MTKKILNLIANFKYYFNFLKDDNDNDFIYINELLLLKLKKINNHWGRNTNYVGDWDDKNRLEELIKDFELVIVDQKTNPSERANIKSNFKIYGKLGNFIPRLWN